MLRTNTGDHERRHMSNGDFLHGSKVTSIYNLRTKAINALQEEVSNGKSPKMPLIPSLESIRLQFVPKNTVAAATEQSQAG